MQTQKPKGKSLFKTYRTDAAMIDGGAWKVDYEADIDVKIRSSKSPIVVAAQESVDERNLPFQRRKKPVPRDVQTLNQVELCVAMIADWRKNSEPTSLPEDDSGSPLACTPENVTAAATQLDEFRLQTIGFALDYANYRAADLEDRAKNSETSGAPSSGPTLVVAQPTE